MTNVGNCVACKQKLESSNTSEMSLLEDMCQTCFTEYVENNIIVKPNNEVAQKINAVKNGEITINSTEELLLYLKNSDKGNTLH
ncbi:hypothetical protein ACIQ1D_19660 [Lysinibacillus xylanilyticus]|uniref:hypothetical protein n=1 Tax=Lysinibacillus xylanilyticus TaxID=582475 RepID=UPI0038228797